MEPNRTAKQNKPVFVRHRLYIHPLRGSSYIGGGHQRVRPSFSSPEFSMTLNHTPHQALSLSPPSEIIPSKPVLVRPVLSLESPPVAFEDYPPLPREPRAGVFVPGYSISTHVFPAAWPRCPSSPFAPPLADMATPMNKEAIAKLVQCLSEKKEAQERGQDSRPLNKNVLWTVANRIVKDTPSKGSRRGLTLIFLHGIGAHKEVRSFVSYHANCS